MPAAPLHPFAPERTALLQARGVGHQFQSNWWCLQEVDMSIRTGELVGLVGPNGSGKSTLLKTLAGQITPTTGTITLDSQPLARYARRELARRIGYLPQVVNAAFAFTVEEVVAQGRYPHGGALGLLSAHDHEVIHRAMEWTHTLAFAKRPVQVLSGGEQQSVFLASVLAQEAEFLLLDEPTSALDLHHQVDVFDRLAELARAGLGVVVITHDLNLAAQYCSRLVLLLGGRVIADGSPAEVIREPILRQAYDAELIVDTNPVTGTPLVVLLGRSAQRRGGQV
jgi:iron complex transport system ATP-binding protein